jgi:hypothetical protein
LDDIALEVLREQAANSMELLAASQWRRFIGIAVDLW